VIRAVIFDLGGTLIDFDGKAASWRGMEERGIGALRRFLVEYGCTLPAADLSDALWEGMRRGWDDAMSGRANACLPDIIAASLARLGVTLDEAACWQAARAYATGVEQGIVPLEGARELLSELKQRGLLVGLLSNTTWPGEFHRQELRAFDLIQFFDVAAFSCELGAWKPNAPAYHHVTDQLGVSPAEAVFVGDLIEIDVLGAQRAGLRGVWISADGGAPGDVKPDAVIHRLADLPAVLEQLASE
jgi:HAD superfamily hydrolase (TIGR01549 family)